MLVLYFFILKNTSLNFLNSNIFYNDILSIFLFDYKGNSLNINESLFIFIIDYL